MNIYMYLPVVAEAFGPEAARLRFLGSLRWTGVTVPLGPCFGIERGPLFTPEIDEAREPGRRVLTEAFSSSSVSIEKAGTLSEPSC